MPSYKELCLHQKRRPFNIKKYTLRWPLMWEMHDVLIIFYLHCDIWNILENIDWHYFCMRGRMRISSFFSSVYKISYHLSFQINHCNKCSWLWLSRLSTIICLKLVPIGKSWLNFMYSKQKIKIFILCVSL